MGKLEGRYALDRNIMSVWCSSLLSLVEDIIGVGKVIKPSGCQIALRFPFAERYDERCQVTGTSW